MARRRFFVHGSGAHRLARVRRAEAGQQYEISRRACAVAAVLAAAWPAALPIE